MGKLETIEDNAREALFKKRKDEAVRLCKKGIALAEKENRPAEIEYLKALLSESEDRIGEAIEYYKKAIKLDNTHVKARSRLGALLDDLGRFDEAEKHYLDALKIDPDDATAHYNYGALLADLKRFDEAEKHYLDALKIDPDDATAHYNYGLLLYNLKRFDEAEKHYLDALKIDPDDATAHNNYGALLYNLKRFDEAEKHYREALKIDPYYANAHNNYGVLLYNLKRFDEAEKHYREALKINPDDANAHNNYGLLLKNLRRFDEAEKYYLDALKINPDHAPAQYNYGALWSDLGRFDDALKHFKKALRLSKKEGNVRWEGNSKWRIKNLNEKTKLQKEAKGVPEKIPELDVVEAVFEELKDKKDAIFGHITKKEKEFDDFISAKRTITSDDNFLVVLRRWNSYTPAMPSEIDKNKGGGYFLSWKGKGIVIDPGFNFVENFIHQGFKIADIDAIMITHAHIDHCIDFEALLTLLHEHNGGKGNDERHKIDVFMSMGAINKFLGWVSLDNGDIHRVYSLDINDIKGPDGYDFALTVTKAKHHEVVSDMYCIGLIFELNDGTKNFRLGLTSDTGYTKPIGEQYKDCDMLVAHLGSVKEDEFDLDKELDDRLYETHLGLIGITRIIKDADPKLAVVSEFGQELEEERVDIVKAINKVLDNRCITGDIGLKIKLPGLKIRCDWCTGKNNKDTYKEIGEIKDVCDPRNDEKKVDYVCKDCLP